MHRLNVTTRARTKILIVGDSIALGASEVIDRNVTGRVERCFVEDLRDAFGQAEWIIDAATTRNSDEVRRLIGPLLETHRPDVALLVLGGSDADLNWRRFIISAGEIATNAVPAERFARNMKQVVETIVAAGAAPVLCDITNHWLDVRGPYLSRLCGRDVSELIRLKGGQERSDAGLEEFRKIARELAAETQSAFVDFTSVLSQHPPQDRVGFDGQHPSDLAHRAIAAAITMVLTRVLRERGISRPHAAATGTLGAIRS